MYVIENFLVVTLKKKIKKKMKLMFLCDHVYLK